VREGDPARPRHRRQPTAAQNDIEPRFDEEPGIARRTPRMALKHGRQNDHGCVRSSFGSALGCNFPRTGLAAWKGGTMPILSARRSSELPHQPMLKRR
jgi:hypothetical protein